MKITKIQNQTNFKHQENPTVKKREFIDVFTDAIKNPADVNDCVAVPRGIFKAYLMIMFGSGILTIAGALPGKWNGVKKAMTILGTGLNILSAVYFAKPFAVKGLSPTIKKEDLKEKN